MRWIDAIGGLYVVPCTFGDPLIRENRDYATTGSAVVNVSGTIEIIAQFNEKTNTIKPNQRFLFGNPNNWHSFKIFGGGVNSFNLMNTNDFFSTGLLRLTLGANQDNSENDDLVRGIADVLQEVHVVSITESNLKMNAGNQYSLSVETTLNGRTVDRDYTWVSNDESVAIVSNDGLVTAKQSGGARIYCYLKNNSEVFDYCDVIVDIEPTENAIIIVEPLINYILQTTSQTFTVYLEKNGQQQSDAFIFTIISPNVPSDNYVFTVLSDNSFSVENKKMYLNEPLIVNCVSGSYVKNISIQLKGGW